MAYTPQEWRNGDAATPLSAERLLHIENGIAGIEHPAPAWADVTGKPATYPPTVGTTATTAKAGDYQPTWAQVSGKPSTFAPAAHDHVTADVTGLDAALSGKAATSHTHTIANVTGLQAALDGKQASGSYATAAALADLVARVEALEGGAA